MYTPKSFELNDAISQYQLIHEYPFGTLVSLCDGALAATHLPLLIAENAAGDRVLQAHVARNNSEFALLQDGSAVLAVFHGPHAYISPSWYPTKASTHGKAVPTWNYVAVHVHGTMTTHSDPAWLLEHLTRQTERYEHNRPDPWSITDAPPDYIETMLKSIVGLEITVQRIEGKEKLSQNRPAADQQGVIDSLRDTQDSALQTALNSEVARRMMKKRPF